MNYQEFKYSIREQFPNMSSANIKKFYVWFSYHQNPTEDNMLTVEVPESIYAECQANHTHSFVASKPCNLTVKQPWWEKPQEGISPMRYDANTASAVASISVPSDEQKKIDYLNHRAEVVYHTIERTLRDMFHLNGPSQPRYYKELIDAIKNGDYEIDEKQAKYADEAWEDFQDNDYDYFDYNAFYGINFTKFPKADYKGRDAAARELCAEYQRVKDVIAIMPAEEALAAVQAFEKWQPSNAPTEQ